jgi:hypothetical protein
MDDYYKLLERLSYLTHSYREDELGPISVEHVEKWASQFESESRYGIINELCHVFEYLYLSKEDFYKYLRAVVNSDKLSNNNPYTFWSNVSILNIQKNGSSQDELVSLINKVIKSELNINFKNNNDRVFVYLDDGLFSGLRTCTDLESWIESTPDDIEIYFVFCVAYRSGLFRLEKFINDLRMRLNKKIKFQLYALLTMENRKYYIDKSEVLWPVAVPSDSLLEEYVASEQRFPFIPRHVITSSCCKYFSSEAGRQLLEREFLLAGMKIRSFSQNPARNLRPLGFSSFGLGFGSLVVTYRNCPNNCPLALWWGDVTAPSHHPFSKWYPLFPRKTYGDSSSFTAGSVVIFEE